MTREKWKDILEGVGFVAIIASLIFVGIETRNSTKQAVLTTQALEMSAYQELIDNILDMNMLIIQDPEVAALMEKAWDNSEQLTDLERFRFSRAAFQRLRHGDMAYFQYERGAIDEERLRSVLRVMNLSDPRMQEFWSRAQDNFVPAYRNYINQLIEQKNSQSQKD
jgi:hypothetical protein